ncbi:MAG: PhoH family protein [Cellulomonadaceae bacterium]|jgi:phosphate starvation-inducible PhoH-like protein|nr:PhoH family protein [Cellulomonadaceae bacterium]
MYRTVIPSSVDPAAVFGPGDAVLKAVEDAFPQVEIHARGNQVSASGSSSDLAIVGTLIDELVEIAHTGTPLTQDVVHKSAAMLADARSAVVQQRPAEVFTEAIVTHRGRAIRPKSLGQKHYVDAIDANTITFGIGPAGTGKTYLAMAKAVQALSEQQVSRLILSRPAVEAGEKLGFLPGTLSDKIDPYLRPLYDALHDMMDAASIAKLIENGTIEVAPLAFLRGRSLSNAFVILDEAQNTTPEQMKMFLTRLGFGSTMVITGDETQIDLPGGTRSGLRVVRDVLGAVEDIEFCDLSSADVVRHRLVGEIVDAYARWEDNT